MRVTVVGARGFIGSHLATYARERGADVIGYRHEEVLDGAARESLGVVFYCSGITVGADSAPLRAFEVHVEALRRLLSNASYERVVYLSSARVYDRAGATSEDTPLPVLPESRGDAYALSKLAGEAITLSASSANRVVRLSNVFGEGMNRGVFLSDILAQARETGIVRLHSALDSSKDYVSIAAARSLLWQIAVSSRERIYNVASGLNTSHRDILAAIRALLPVEIVVDPDAPLMCAAPVDIARINGEYGAAPSDLVAELPSLLGAIPK